MHAAALEPPGLRLAARDRRARRSARARHALSTVRTLLSPSPQLYPHFTLALPLTLALTLRVCRRTARCSPAGPFAISNGRSVSMPPCGAATGRQMGVAPATSGTTGSWTWSLTSIGTTANGRPRGYPRWGRNCNECCTLDMYKIVYGTICCLFALGGPRSGLWQGVDCVWGRRATGAARRLVARGPLTGIYGQTASFLAVGGMRTLGRLVGRWSLRSSEAQRSFPYSQLAFVWLPTELGGCPCRSAQHAAAPPRSEL